MKNTLTEAITFLFNELPFSKENERLKKELTLAAYQKYEEALAQGQSPSESAANMILNCGDINMLCTYLHIDLPQEAAELQEVQSKKTFLKTFRKLRNCIYALSLSLILVLGIFLNLLFHFTLKNFLFSIAALIPLLFLAGLSFVSCQKIKLITLFQVRSYQSECRQTAESIYDRYTKKLTNSILMAVALGLILLFTMILSIITSKYTLYNALQKIEFSLTAIQFVCYFLLKNHLCRMTVKDFFQERQTDEYRTEIKRLCLCSTGYYFCCFLFLFFMKDATDYLLNYLFALILLYGIAVLAYNLIRRRKLTYKNVVINIKKIVCCTLAVVIFLLYSMMKLDLFLTQPYINTVSAVDHTKSDISYQEDSGIYTITTNAEHFKILQLTDIHLGGSFQSLTQDLSALRACERLIRETEPDFVIVTGDLVFPLGIMSFSLNNNAPITQFASFMRNIGIPWAFTYGNHDTEEIATLNRAEFDALMKSLSYKTSKNLLYPYVQPDIYGRSNQVIELRSSDGTLMQALFLIDSNDYIAGASKINEYDYIHDDQVEWYQRMVKSLCEKENRVIPSMIFTHIPLKEYQIANQLYEDGSDEVTYYYGIIGERMTDKICCSKHDSKLFETAAALGSTKAIFCGHDHYNNLSLEYRGIRLTYGYSIDYLAMPGIENDTEQRGATLITIAKDGSFEITPYRLMDLS